MTRFDAGFRGPVHQHEEPESAYVLDGSVRSQGVEMGPGFAYAAPAGSTHEEFFSEGGCTMLFVLKAPG